MKKIISLLLLSFLILSSCSIDWNNEKEQRIIELEKKVSELQEEKGNDCSNIADEILLEWNNDLYSIGHQNIDNIFYSKIKDSCIYVIKETSKWGVYNYTTKETIFETESPLKYCSTDKCSQDIEKTIESKILEIK